MTTPHLRTNTITNEFAFITKAANVETQCCPHLLTHRFITTAAQLTVDRNLTKNWGHSSEQSGNLEPS